jgi:hypothetical protein
MAHAALAAKALEHAGDLYTSGRRREALRAIILAARLEPRTVGPRALRLLASTARGYDYGCYSSTKHLLAALAEQLGPTRYGTRLRAAAAVEPRYEEVLLRVARHLRRTTPRNANVATVTKWDPTLLWLSRRRGVQFPDRRQMPHGYPRDDTTVIAHLELLRARGVTHLVFTAASTWWLQHYAAFGAHLNERYELAYSDTDCTIYDLRR